VDKEHKLLFWQLTAASSFYNIDTTCPTYTSVHNLVTSVRYSFWYLETHNSASQTSQQCTLFP